MRNPPNKVPDVGSNARREVAQVSDLMTTSVITISRHQTIGQARDLLAKHGIHSVPVIDGEGEPIGVISSSDLIGKSSKETLIGQVMTREVFTISQYSGFHIAARMMRKHKIHHLIVTHEKKVVGIISSYDLLELVEDRRFVMKNQPSRPKKGGGKRRKEEDKPGK